MTHYILSYSGKREPSSQICTDKVFIAASSAVIYRNILIFLKKEPCQGNPAALLFE